MTNLPPVLSSLLHMQRIHLSCSLSRRERKLYGMRNRRLANLYISRTLHTYMHIKLYYIQGRRLLLSATRQALLLLPRGRGRDRQFTASFIDQTRRGDRRTSSQWPQSVPLFLFTARQIAVLLASSPQVPLGTDHIWCYLDTLRVSTVRVRVCVCVCLH